MPDTEIWKPIKGFEGLYEVSSLGRVRSMERRVKGRANSVRNVPAKILKLNINKNRNSVQISLRRDGKIFTVQVPKAVMEAFTDEKPPGDARVLHIDGDICNNALSNLRYRKSFYLPENPEARELFYKYAEKNVRTFIRMNRKYIDMGIIDTNDFQQEALLRIWMEIDQYSTEISFIAFCNVTCRHIFNNLYKKYRRIKSREISAYETCGNDDSDPLYLIDTLVSNDNFYERIDDNA